jgi:predicted dehydrogenase
MRPVLTFEYRDGDPIGPGTPTMGERASETDDAAVIAGRFTSGALFTLAGTWNAHHPTGARVEAYGDQGTLVLDSAGRIFGGRKGEPALVEMPIAERYALPPIAPGAGAMTRLVQDLARAIKGEGSPAPPYHASFADGLQVQRVMDAVLAGGGHATPG